MGFRLDLFKFMSLFFFFFFFFFVFLNGSLMVRLDWEDKRGYIVEFTRNCFSFSFVLFTMNFDKKGQKNWVNRMFFFFPFEWFFGFFFSYPSNDFFFCFCSFFFFFKTIEKEDMGSLTQEIILGVHSDFQYSFFIFMLNSIMRN